jgi:PAS domain S-box-containing protein
MASYQPAFDEGGEVIGVSVAVTDITDKKRAQEALQESDDGYRFVFELNSQVQWILDAQGNLLQMSSRWEETTGQTKERTCNLGWLDVVHPEDVGPTMKAMRSSLSTGQPINTEYRVKTIDGRWRWMRSRGAPCYGPSGEILRWYGSVEDISEHRKTKEMWRRRQLRLANPQPNGSTMVTHHV